MKYNVNIQEIGAEMLLNYLYPELEDKWIVHNEGTFYRNYNNDALSLNEEKAKVDLARDGFLSLLPQAFISSENELRNGAVREKTKEISKRKKILQEAFLPVDSLHFRQKLKLEREISSLLNEKLQYILKNYFSFDLKEEKNKYVREFAVLLPYVKDRRGDFGFIKKMLSYMFGTDVNLFLGRYSDTDSSRKSLPALRFEIYFDNLSKEEFIALKDELLPLKEFLKEWFIPAEIHTDILIKGNNIKETLDNDRLILNYNTQLDPLN